MRIEVVGISPHNKGALLMLDAICDAVWTRYPDAEIAVPLPWPNKLRVKRKLLASVPVGFRGVMPFLRIIPAPIADDLGIVKRNQIDVILDASGFGYGDYWGLKKIWTRLVRRLSNKKLILLPQALGPFEKPGMAFAWRKVANSANLIFVRDKTSLSYVKAAGGPRTNTFLAPDFTNLIKPALPVEYAHLIGKSLIIPNRKMISDKFSLSKYLDFLVLCVSTLRKSGREPIALIHEGKDDRSIIDLLNKSLDRKIEPIEIDSPIDTKALIAGAELIVASRFHALVSALSSGVPALSAGWSHKYKELMEDYECERHLVDMSQPNIWRDKIDGFLAEVSDNSFRDSLHKASSRQVELTKKMWSQVFEVIDR